MERGAFNVFLFVFFFDHFLKLLLSRLVIQRISRSRRHSM